MLPFRTSPPLLVLLVASVMLTVMARADGAAFAGEAPSTPRPLLVTVDDLPLQSRGAHEAAADRIRITEGMLAAMAKHHVKAVGMVTWGNVRDETDRRLLAMWLEAGHELGNHTVRHLNHAATSAAEYAADAEEGRRRLDELLAPRGARARFFRFPMLREGETAAKVEAMRRYLRESGQRNLIVTIDNQDWSFERPFIEATRAGASRRAEEVRQDYLAALRLAVRHHERSGDELLGRRAPQILLLHATSVGAAAFDDLFGWLAAEGHRFAAADEVMADPAFAPEALPPHPWPYGFGLWDRLRAARRIDDAAREVSDLVAKQVAAWNAHDLEGFCAPYAEEALFVSPSGLTRGRQAVYDRYVAKYGKGEGMGALTIEVIDAEPVLGMEVSMQGDAVPGRVHSVVVTGRWTLTWPAGSGKEPATGHTLLTFGRRGAGWEILRDASM